MNDTLITPKTKIFELLQKYPQLEDYLVEAAPEFRKLRNPVLRNTVARITSLAQAAIIGGLPVEDLVNRLRKKVGQDTASFGHDQQSNYTIDCPAWFNGSNVIKTIDIREMINHGEQPVHEVLGQLQSIRSTEILEVIAPFVPAPLLDKSLSLGFRHWLEKRGPDEYHVFFIR
jgi:hypothetical protein